MSYGLVKGDTKPDMLITLKAPGAQAELATATSLDMRWLRPDGTAVTVPLVLVDAVTFRLKRVWSSGDADQVGWHRGQVKITTLSGGVTSDPDDGSYLVWEVTKPLGDLL